MSTPTISEDLFEQLCSQRRIACARISEGSQKTADYCVSLDSLTLVTEVKQLDPSDADKNLDKTWGTPNFPGAVAPSDRVQRLLEEAYSQVKRSCEGMRPTMIVVYNNSGPWNWIDTFTIAKAMFGSFGIVLGLQTNQKIAVTGHGYLGKRKVTKDTFRSLSVVGVLKRVKADAVRLDCYHNPFANIRVEPAILTTLADAQYMHPNPHDRGFVPWGPKKLET
ncbi:MAG TPA: hypothetical protein VJM76_06465 [Gammaproteobacteria bacterium]|nr:hypothetical protein [Gammaproteobacteria bacterium]